MKYTASDVIERAMNLADISHSDVISWKENIQYLNDAWKSVYQLMINKGDKIFVREVYLRGSAGNGYISYDLPKDFYQMVSLKNPASGYIYTRHAESEGYNAGSYEIVNNELRVYGISEKLLLTYWVDPLFLTFPNKTLSFDRSEKIISTAGNNVLLSDGTIYNIISGSVVGSFPMEGDTDSEIQKHEIVLGNGHIVEYVVAEVELEEETKTMTTLSYYGYDSIELFSKVYSEEAIDISFYRDSDFNIYYEIEDKKYLLEREIDSSEIQLFSLDQFPIGVYDHWRDCYLSTTENGNVVLNHGNTKETLDINDIQILGFTSYGVITSNGTAKFVKSWYPETILNFPNNIYFQLLSAELALLYCLKQNISNEGVNQLYQSYRIQYMDSLSNDGNYSRLVNVY